MWVDLHTVAGVDTANKLLVPVVPPEGAIVGVARRAVECYELRQMLIQNWRLWFVVSGLWILLPLKLHCVRSLVK